MRARKKSGWTMMLAPMAVLAVWIFTCPSPIPAQEEPLPVPGDETVQSEKDADDVSSESVQPDVRTDSTYSYNAAGRRDPFKSLLEKSNESTGKRPEGLPGILIGEVDLLGILKRHDDTFVAMIQGSNKETFNVLVGERLFDGFVEEIHSDRVIFTQHIDDPTSPRKNRQITVMLNPYEEGS